MESGEGSNGGGGSVNQSVVPAPSLENIDIAQEGTETSKAAPEIFREATPPTGDNGTGREYADEVAGFARSGGGVHGTLEELAKGGVIENKTPDIEPKNIHQAGIDNRRELMNDQDQDTPNESPAYQSKADTNPDTKPDQAEPPTEDKEGGEKTSEGEKSDEKNEDPKSEKEKQVEEKLQMADIVSQIKDINPDFDPKNPEARAFLKNLAENPDQMKTADDTLKILGEQKTVLENSDTIKNLGISPKDLVRPAAIGTLKALSGTIEKAIKELAGKPSLTKEEQDKNKKDGLLLAFLKALGLMLATGVAAALAAGKEIKK